MAFFNKDFLLFFKDLAANNNKDWFDKNRSRYEESVREPFKVFVQGLIDHLKNEDDRYAELEAKDCIFKINRDIRFSKDKTPYKLMASAVIAPRGKKSSAVNGIYFEFGSEVLSVYGGVYEINREDLLRVRETIANNPLEFSQLFKSPEFLATYKNVLGEKNKILPVHLRKAGEKEPLIYQKQWYFCKTFKADSIVKDDLDELLIRCYQIGKPIEDYFNKIIKR